VGSTYASMRLNNTFALRGDNVEKEGVGGERERENLIFTVTI